MPAALRDGLYRNPNGKRWHFHIKWKGRVLKGDTGHESRTLAKEWLRAYRETLADQAVGLAPRSSPTLREVWQEWARVKAGQVVPSHLAGMRLAVETHASAWVDRPINQLNTAAIEQIRSGYLGTVGRIYRRGGGFLEREHSEGGANTVVKLLRALCHWAVAVGHLPQVPFQVKRLKPQEPHRPVVWPEQLELLLRVARAGRNPHSFTAIWLMVGLGLREGEALNASWEAVDFRRNVFVVLAAKDRSVREIPIPPKLRAHLWSLRPAKWEPKDLVLPGDDGDRHIEGYTRKPVFRCGLALGVTGLTPHRLRATFATGHFEIGTPLSQIQLMLGHESPSTTMGYIVQRPKDQAISQARWESFLEGGSHTVPTVSATEHNVNSSSG